MNKNITKSDIAKAINSMNFMAVEEVKEKIANHPVVTLTFFKKNGELRVMKASRNWEFLKKYAPATGYVTPNGKGLRYNNEENDLVTVFDIETKKDKDGNLKYGGFKQVPANRMLSVVVG